MKKSAIFIISIHKVAASLASQPADPDILISFYKSVRPFGLWKPIARKAGLSTEEMSSKSESVLLAILNVVLAMLAITGLYLFPMYLVGHWYMDTYASYRRIDSMIWLVLAIAAMLALKYTWYQFLPAADRNSNIY